MSQQTFDEFERGYSASKNDRPHTVSVCVFFVTLIAAALFLQQIWWTILISIELILIVGIVHALGSNLPKRMNRQVRLNCRRADGSRSNRRSEIERGSVRRFKFDVLFCFAFTLIPANVFVLVHLYFFPQLTRLKETTELGPKQEWAAIFLEPGFQLLLLLSLLAVLLYDSLKGIYLRRLKDLDDEICRRAENYAVYDLVNPPNRHRDHRKPSKKVTEMPGIL